MLVWQKKQAKIYLTYELYISEIHALSRGEGVSVRVKIHPYPRSHLYLPL